MTDDQNCSFDVVPLVEAEKENRPSLNNLNYTNQDFWSMKARLIQFTKDQFKEEFTDFIESDLAIMLIENVAFVADTLSFKMDQIANEIFIDTVTEIDNAFRLSELVGFQPLPPIAARAFFSATINQALDTDLVLSTPVSIDLTSNGIPISYELFPAGTNGEPLFDEDIVISAGQFSNTQIVGLEGSTSDSTFVSNGTANQSFVLPLNPVIFDSVNVNVDGVRWTRVDYFTDQNPRREYRVEFTSNYEAFIIFGNGSGGLIPSVGSNILATYRTGGGSVGNIVTNSINVQKNEIIPGFDFGITVTYVNYTRGEFGYNGDTVEDIRRKLPAYLETQDRAVTGTDYKTLANQFVTISNGQVGASNAVLKNNGCSANIIDVYILAQDDENSLQQPEDGLKIQLLDYLDTKKMMTDALCIKDGVILTVDVIMDVVSNKFFKKFKEEIEVQIDRRINGFFDLANWDFDRDLISSDIVKVVSDINEIDRVVISLVTPDPDNSGQIVQADFFEIIRPGDITINFIFE